MKPSVSVIITTYNRPAELLEAVSSVRNQSVLPAEIIVVNDGKKYREIDELEHEGIILHQNSKPMGGNYARNKGASLSSGDILMFLDDDDTWERTKIEDQVSVFETDKEADLVYTGKIFVRRSDREKIQRISKPTKEGYIFKEMLFINIVGSTSGVALRRNLFFSAGMFDENLKALQDYDLWLRCAKIAKIRHDGKTNLRYTLQDSGSQVSQNVNSKMEAIDVIKNKLSTEYQGLSPKERRKFDSVFYYAIAKALKMNNEKRYIFWLMKSLFTYPIIERFNLLLPNFIIRMYR